LLPFVVALAAAVVCAGCGSSGTSSAFPLTEDFSDCGGWSTDNDAGVALDCEQGHYHFGVKKAEDPQSSTVSFGDETAERVMVSADVALTIARSEDFGRLSEVGLGCWRGGAEGHLGYVATVGPRGFSIAREEAGRAADIPATEGAVPQRG
jgi:hypothetical protein